MFVFVQCKRCRLASLKQVCPQVFFLSQLRATAAREARLCVCVFAVCVGLAKQGKCFKGQKGFQCQGKDPRGSMRARGKCRVNEREREGGRGREREREKGG